MPPSEGPAYGQVTLMAGWRWRGVQCGVSLDAIGRSLGQVTKMLELPLSEAWLSFDGSVQTQPA
jgi:hypothetical protein